MNEESIGHEGAIGIATAAIMVDGSGARDPRVAAFLDRQSRLAELQIEDFERGDRLRHWSLRLHHVAGVMKLAFELSAAFILVVLAIFLGSAIWEAAHDDALVIEAFDVPPDLAARGLSGQVMAARVEDRLAWMQAHTVTSRPASTYRHDWGDDIKVQIPQTGVSVGEFYRYLSQWLGHQTHISGDIWHGSQGLAIATRIGSNPAPIIRGSENNLDALLVKAAEQIYRQTQPYRYIAYLDRQNRVPEELAAARELALNGPPEEQAWAYTRWGVTLQSRGQFRQALQKQRMATVLGPSLPHAWYDLGATEAPMGHDEASLADNLRALSLLNSSAAEQLAPNAVAVDIPILTMLTAEATGDYRSAVAQVPAVEELPNYGDSHLSAAIMKAADLAADHDVGASRRLDHDGTGEAQALALGANGSFDLQPQPSFLRAAALSDWRAARADLLADERSPAARNPALLPVLPVLMWPWLAYAEAKLGNFAQADALIGRTPGDCYVCLRLRGAIRVAEGRSGAAAYWFKRAVQTGPSLPFAYADWGAMLMAKGDYDGAIEKLAAANQKGPHFADPLEMWGEALIARNRSDLALVKFEEAGKYAPNWGRLHLKWGEALWWTGEKNKARAQFTAASHLDLTAREESEVNRVRSLHG